MFVPALCLPPSSRRQQVKIRSPTFHLLHTQNTEASTGQWTFSPFLLSFFPPLPVASFIFSGRRCNGTRTLLTSLGQSFVLCSRFFFSTSSVPLLVLLLLLLLGRGNIFSFTVNTTYAPLVYLIFLSLFCIILPVAPMLLTFNRGHFFRLNEDQ